MCKDIALVEICDLFNYYRLENDGTIFISPYQVVISYNMLLSISELLCNRSHMEARIRLQHSMGHTNNRFLLISLM
jgi:hypothetical protein